MALEDISEKLFELEAVIHAIERAKNGKFTRTPIFIFCKFVPKI